MLEKIKALIQRGNELGFPILVVRDPISGKGSISATLVFLSSVCVIVSLVTAKVSNSGAFEFFVASASLYFGRKLTTKAGTSIDTKST